MKPTISIIIPCHTNDYFVECLESVATQTDKDFTTIVVFDKCTDNAPQIAEAYRPLLKDLRVYYTDGGKPSVARNKGLKECETDYFWFIDSDDAVTHTAVAHIRRVIENMKQYYGQTINVLALNEFCTPVLENDILNDESEVAPTRNNVFCFLYVVNRLFAESCNLRFDERLTYLEDAQFSARLLFENYLHTPQFQTLNFYYMHTPVYWHRINENSMCNKGKERRLKDEYENRFAMYEYINQYTDKVILDKAILTWLFTMCRILTEQAYYKKIPFINLLKKDLPEIKRLAKGRNRMSYQINVAPDHTIQVVDMFRATYLERGAILYDMPKDIQLACDKIFFKEVFNANVSIDPLNNRII